MLRPSLWRFGKADDEGALAVSPPDHGSNVFCPPGGPVPTHELNRTSSKPCGCDVLPSGGRAGREGRPLDTGPLAREGTAEAMCPKGWGV